MQIVADKQIPYVTELFSRFASIDLYDGREINADKIHYASILLIRSVTRVNADLLVGSQVKFVASFTSGHDHIDIDYLKENNIGYADTKGSNARSVAEYVISSLFVLAEQFNFNLQDKSVGIIGCGEVGSLVADMLDTVGVHIMMSDPFLRDAFFSVFQGGVNIGQQYRDIKELFSADILTLHVPLIKEGLYPTQQLVDADFLERVKDDVILLNTSRGDVIDEDALKKHLRDKRIKLVLDVWQGEPNIDLSLLTGVIIGTPHIAGYSAEGKVSAIEIIFKSICKFLSIYTFLSAERLLELNNQELLIEVDMADEDAIKKAVLASYDVRRDQISLQCLSEQVGEQQRGAYFDQLRSNYAIRTEFSAMTVHCPQNRELLIKKLQKMGFIVKMYP